MLSVVSQRWRRITSACCRLRLRSWPCSDAASCLPARRSVAFLRPWTRRVWKRCAVCSRPGRAGPPRTRRRRGGSVGSARTTLGGLRVLSARDRLHDSVPCLRVLSCPLPIVVLIRSVRLATRGASVEKWYAPARHSCRPILISGWERLAEQAMATTEVSSCKGWRWWWRISAHRASCLLRPSFDWMACMATEPLSRI